jgi:methylenetetrahydrofolate reductase (NADPH)
MLPGDHSHPEAFSMKVIEHLQRAKKPLVSFEIIPPRRGGSLESLLGLIGRLARHQPPFIDITSHPAVISYEEGPQGLRRVVKRKRPGTLGLCALVQHKFGIDAVPHVICRGFSKEETEDFLIELHYLGIDNILAIRGDDNGYDKPLSEGRSNNTYASDLVEQVAEMKQGNYLDRNQDSDPTKFCVGVAGYPEKHFEAPNLSEDVANLKRKVTAGAEYVVTQMFFNNDHYFSFVERCRAAGITVPIIPGLKVLASQRQLTMLPKTFLCELPEELVEKARKADPKAVVDVGIEWATKQSQELLDAGVPALHYYVMQNTRAVDQVLAGLKR